VIISAKRLPGRHLEMKNQQKQGGASFGSRDQRNKTRNANYTKLIGGASRRAGHRLDKSDLGTTPATGGVLLCEAEVTPWNPADWTTTVVKGPILLKNVGEKEEETP